MKNDYIKLEQLTSWRVVNTSWRVVNTSWRVVNTLWRVVNKFLYLFLSWLLVFVYYFIMHSLVFLKVDARFRFSMLNLPWIFFRWREGRELSQSTEQKREIVHICWILEPESSKKRKVKQEPVLEMK